VAFGALRKLRQGLTKTRDQLLSRIGAAVRREVHLTDTFLEEIEDVLVGADLGVEAASALALGLGRRLRERGGQATMEDVTATLRDQVLEILQAGASAPSIPGGPPHVVMMVGVNGVGKTTSIAKLAHYHVRQGRRVLIAAADTFRAAAVEQLDLWSRRAGADIVKQAMGADPAAVAFDALGSGRARGHDVVIIDTAGRLQTKEHLMRELEKLARVCARQVEGAPHETLLCLDATTGQNGIAQAREFAQATPLSGIFLTKLDGTAKGGVVVAIARTLGLPVRYVGTGEGLDDFAAFDAAAFAHGLFDPRDEE
jgi:fused signal recognition particle receptor